MKAKEIFLWLFIFIVGSLIVTFLVSPGSFQSFKGNLGNIAKDLVPEQSLQQADQVNSGNLEQVVVQDNSQEIKMIYRISCAMIDTLSRSQGLNPEQEKETQCTFNCGIENMDYHHFECTHDSLRCFCESSPKYKENPQ